MSDAVLVLHVGPLEKMFSFSACACVVQDVLAGVQDVFSTRNRRLFLRRMIVGCDG